MRLLTILLVGALLAFAMRRLALPVDEGNTSEDAAHRPTARKQSTLLPHDASDRRLGEASPERSDDTAPSEGSQGRWPADLEASFREDNVVRMVDALLIGCPQYSLEQLSCSEYPCIVYLHLTLGEDKDYCFNSQDFWGFSTPGRMVFLQSSDTEREMLVSYIFTAGHAVEDRPGFTDQLKLRNNTTSSHIIREYRQ